MGHEYEALGRRGVLGALKNTYRVYKDPRAYEGPNGFNPIV